MLKNTMYRIKLIMFKKNEKESILVEKQQKQTIENKCWQV